MKREDDIVLLTVVGSEVEAGMLNQDLEQAGIKALIRPGGPGAGAWASAATFDHQVFVRADQFELAQKVLGEAGEFGTPLPRARRTAPKVNRVRVPGSDSE